MASRQTPRAGRILPNEAIWEGGSSRTPLTPHSPGCGGRANSLRSSEEGREPECESQALDLQKPKAAYSKSATDGSFLIAMLRIFLTADLRLCWPKIPVPLTKTSAPARAHSPTVSKVMPPSTSMW